MRATIDRFSQAIAAARREMPLRAQLAACSWCPTEAATSASTAGAQADVHKNRTRGRRGAVVPDETGPHTERVSESPWQDSSLCANTSRNPQFLDTSFQNRMLRGLGCWLE